MVAKRKNYPPEFKRDALDLVHSSKDRSLTDIARSLGIHLETLRHKTEVSAPTGSLHRGEGTLSIHSIDTRRREIFY